MGITRGDNRPRDWAYIARFKASDLPSLQQMIGEIQQTHNTGIIEDFNQRCEQKLAAGDPTVTKSEDLAVNGGIQQCLNIILGTSSTRWSHIGVSGGNTPAPAVTDTALLAETLTNRIPISTQGWAEARGMRLFFGGISGQADSSSTTRYPSGPYDPSAVSEVGVYNGSAAGATLLNRSSFPTIGSAYVSSDDAGTLSEISTAPIVISIVIEFCPVT